MTKYAAFIAKQTGLQPVSGGNLVLYKPVPSDPYLVGMTQVFETQFDKIDSTKFHIYDSTVFSTVANQHQAYMATNVVTGNASAGATNGTSVKLQVKRETIQLASGPQSFTAGLMDTKTAGFWFPRYGRTEFRCKTPHGQGLWPSIWLTAKNGGSKICEFDIMEYFHGQLPGRNSSSLHGASDATHTSLVNRYTNNGAPGASPRTFFEAPTYDPQWFTWAGEVIPVTDSTGVTPADPTKPSQFVRFRVYVNGVLKVQWVDTSALYWSTNGGADDSFWNLYIQGSQVGGNYVGEIDGPLGYSTFKNICLISGTAPNACSITSGGYTVQRANLTDPASTLEVDYVRNYKYTG